MSSNISKTHDLSQLQMQGPLRPISHGPLFLDPKNEDWAAFTADHFQILELQSSDGINQIPELVVTCALPSKVAKLSSHPLKNSKSASDYKHKDYASTEGFLSAQLFKRVAIHFPRPLPEHVPKSRFEVATYWQGIVTEVELLPTAGFDIVKITLKSALSLLSYQNNYRSFEDKTTQEVLTAVLEPYISALKAENFDVNFQIVESPKRVQIVQKGETDYAFMLRLLEEDGLSFFHVHTEASSRIFITDSLVNAFRNVRKEFTQIKDDITFYFDLQSNLHHLSNVRTLEGAEMPLFGYGVKIRPQVQECLLFDAVRDYRLADKSLKPSELKQEEANSQLEQTSAFLPKQIIPSLTTHLVNMQTSEREDYFNGLGKRALNTSATSSHHSGGSMHVFGFWPIWRTCLLKSNLSSQRLLAKTNYESNFLDKEKQEFQAYSVQHRLRHPQFENYQQAPQQNIAKQYSYCEVDVKFMLADDEDFLLSQDKNQLSTRSYSGPYTGIVAEFVESTDKTEKDFEVPNTIRVQMPWHDQNNKESIKARWSTFAASKESGSLFIPEVGDEVLVMFMDGDPDYPVIVNSLYNAQNNYPLQVANREKEGPFATRGVMFSEQKAKFTFGPVKNDNDTVDILSLTTKEGNCEIAAANIDVTADKTYSVSVEEPKSTMIFDDKQVAITALNNGSKIEFAKDSLTSQSKSVSIEGNSKVEVKSAQIDIKGSAQITANSMKLPG